MRLRLLLVGLGMLITIAPQGCLATGEQALRSVREAVGRGDYGSALGTLMLLIQRDPGDIRQYDLLVETGTYARMLGEVDGFLSGRLRAGRDAGTVLYAIGLVEIERGRWSRAESLLMKSLEMGASEICAYAALEVVYERLYGTAGTIRRLRAATQLTPYKAGAWYALALAYWSQLDLSKSLAAARQALRYEPQDARISQLIAGVQYSERRTPATRASVVRELKRVDGQGDFEGLAFMRWVLLNDLAAPSPPDSNLLILALADSRQLGQHRWVGYFSLEVARHLAAKGSFERSLLMIDTAMAAFSLAQEQEGLISSHSLRMTILLGSGRFAEGLESCFRVIGNSGQLDDDRLKAGAAIDAAWILTNIGGSRVGLILAIHAQDLLDRSKHAAHDRVRLDEVFARIHEGLGDTALALGFARTAHDLSLVCSPTGELHAACEGTLGRILMNTGNADVGLVHCTRQWTLSRQLKEPGEEKEAAMAIGIARLKQGSLREANDWARRARDVACATGDRFGQARSHILLARIAEARGDRTNALSEYTLALPGMSALRQLRMVCCLLPEMRDWYVSQHIELICGFARLGAVAEAASLLARARADVAPSNLRPSDVMSVSHGKRQDFAKRLDLRRLASLIHNWVLEGSPVNPSLPDSTRDRLVQFFTTSNSAARDSIVHDDAASAHRLGLRREMSVIQGLCARTGTLYLDYVSDMSDSYLFIFTGSGPVVHRVQMTGASIMARVEQMRRSWMRVDSPEAIRINEALSDSLLRWLPDLSHGYDGIAVVGSGVQDVLPIEALRILSDGGRDYLINHFAVSYVAAIDLGAIASSKRSPIGQGVLVLVDPVEPDHTADFESDEQLMERLLVDPLRLSIPRTLPGTRLEADVLEEAFGPCVVVRSGREATEEALEDVSSGSLGLIHIGSHARESEIGEGADALLLSPSLRNNGILTASEIMQLDLDGQLVVLSGCSTGAWDLGGKGGSIAYSFLVAGAGTVLSTRWSVDDLTAAGVMKEFYTCLSRGEEPVQALRMAIVHTLEIRDLTPEVWAAFKMVRSGRQTRDLRMTPGSPSGLSWSILVVGSGVVISLLWGIVSRMLRPIT